ncbi:MAG: DNA polymerase I [Kiritimatiellia bacterium]|jgi:DNA polymerase-1
MDGKLFVIDVMPFLYRGYFAFLKKPRITSSGVNTSALHGFAASLAQILAEHDPTHLALAFDSTTPTFRHDAFPAYKAKRQKMPEDLAAAIPQARELAEAMRIPTLRVEGFEADDVLGALATVAADAGLPAVLATPDKDAAQLVSPMISLFRPGKGASPAEIFGPDEVRSQWGVADASQIVDLLAMEGDASDNIPGIPGVGEKTALSLLRQYGSLDAVLAHASEIPGKLGEKVAAGAESARLSRFLATIRRDVPLDVTLDDLVRREPDVDALRAVLAKYELFAVGRRLLGDDSFEKASDAETPFATLATIPHDYRCADTPELRAELEAELSAAPFYAIDTETSSLDPWAARIVGASFCSVPGKAWYLPVPPPEDAACGAAIALLRRLLEDPSKTRVGHNLKYDIAVLRRQGIRLRGEIRDTLLEHYVLDAAGRHDLDTLCRQYLHYEKIPIERLIGPRGKDQRNMADLPPREIADYACEDADFTLRLHRRLEADVEAAGLRRALAESEEPLVRTLVEMELEGVRIDPAALHAFGDELEEELRSLESRIQAYAAEAQKTRDAESAGDLPLFAGVPSPAPPPVNIASPKQLGELLFDRMKLDPNARRTPSGQYATDEETLLKLSSRHPIVGAILEHRASSKLKSTYVDKLPTWIRPETGRIHTHFSQAMTETGRLSSYDPNLQNIPVRSAQGKRVRAAFVPRDAGHLLMSADYSQIELRVMAALSGDAGMLEAFARGADIHAETATRVYGVPAEAVTPEMRSHCKMVNFGIIYGISAFGLGQRLGIPRKQAAELIESYFEQYPGVKAYMDRAIALAREKGYAETWTGRRRTLRDISSRNAVARQAAERNAINTPVQGTAADLVKLAMVRAHAALDAAGLRTKMVLQVHDELLFDVPRDEVEVVRPLVREAMTGALDIGVPLDVDIGVGEDWLQAI